MDEDQVRVYIGYDPASTQAYEVAERSFLRNVTQRCIVNGLYLEALQKQGHYWREHDPLQSTPFTYTRFLVPHLSRFKDTGLYFDCDFLWLRDPAEMLDKCKDKSKAVWVVKHDYKPKEKTKMNGQIQSLYPRKNWSSLMVFNNSHKACRALTREVVNEASAAFLHRFEWCKDSEIGELPKEWNWLEGWYGPGDGSPNAIHYTRGGPWLADWQNCEYADLWKRERARIDARG